MRILFEEEWYSRELLESYGLDPYIYTSKEDDTAVIPYVGYFYSPKINDSIFILPKVFLFEGSGDASMGEVAFGKFHFTELIEISKERNPLKEQNLDGVVFGLSTWIYQAIDKFDRRNPLNTIVQRTYLQEVNGRTGDNSQTLLDTILSLINFHKQHANLFTYISIINSSGNNKIHWSKTISKVQPVIQNGQPYYMEFRNKAKAINYDEDIIVLFYSVLEYLRKTYFFPIHANLNYEFIKVSKIESMIEGGRGTRYLRSIRKKYFKDELVSLWNLLYAFFDKAENIKAGRYHSEALLARSFNIVFEDMVDHIIGQDIFRDLKENKDGKQIDHIYKDKSLIDDNQVYFIGDSKYYFSDHEIGTESLYKQFTYAKNIIQLNIDIFNKKDTDRRADEKKIISGTRYRDSLTEGYEITPNFFVRGFIKKDDVEDGKANYTDMHLTPDNQFMPVNKHFQNRLFDRDTLLLQSYNINFLFVLASYVNKTDNEALKQKIHDKFREDLVRMFESKYDIYKLTPTCSIEDFVNKHFRELIGKMYRSSDTEEFVWLAYEKGTSSLNSLLESFGEEADIVKSTL